MGLLTHQQGPFLVLAQIAYYIDDRLSFETVEGRFIDGFKIEGLSYEAPNGDWIKADNVTVNWQPFKLLLGKIHFDTVNIDGLHLNIDTDVIEPLFESTQLVPIQIHQLQVNTGIWQTNSQKFEFTQADCRLRMNFFSLYCDTFSGTWPNGKIKGQFKYRFRSSELAGNFEQVELGTEFGTLQAKTEVTATNDSFRIKGEASHPIQGEFEITLHDLFHQPHWNAEVDCISCLASTVTQTLNQAQLSASAVLSGQGTLDTSVINVDTNINLQTGIQYLPDLPLHIVGKIDNADSTAFDLNITAEKIVWPLLAIPNTKIEALDAQLIGVPEDYRFTGKAMLMTKDTPVGELFIEAKGTQQSLHISQLELHQEKGKLTGAVNIHTDSVVHAHGALKLDQLDLSTVNPVIKSLVDAVIDFRGSYTKMSRTIELDVKQAKGSWNEIPLQAEGKLSLVNDELTIHNFQMRSSDASLALSGSRKQYWNVDWVLHVPALTQLSSLGQGKLNAAGKIRGTRQDPTLLMQLHSPTLKWGDILLQNSSLKIDWTGKESDRSYLSFTSESVSVYEARPLRLSLNSFGNLERNSFTIEVDSIDDSLVLQGEGGFNAANTWHGVIDAGQIHSQHWGQWQLTAAAPLIWESPQLTTKQLCWKNLTAKFCGSGYLNSELDAQTTIEFTSFPIEMLTKEHINNIELPGFIEGSLVWKSTKHDASATLNASLPPNKIYFSHADNRQSSLSYQQSALTLKWRPDSLTVNLDLDLINEDYLHVKVHSLSTGRPDATSPLEVELATHLTDLQIFENALPQFEEFTGQLSSKLSLTHNLIEPKIIGSIKLQDFSLFIPDTGIYLTDSEIEAFLEETTITGNGRLHSGDGWANVNWNLARDAAIGQLSIEGKNFKVMDLPYAMIALSPNITGHYEHQILDLNGDVYIDQARLLPPKLSLAIRPSSDIREIEDTGPNIHIHSNLALELSDDVYFSGFNISGYLSGSLDVVDKTEEYTVAHGKVTLREGLYQALDSQLEISEGYFFFDGQSIFDPVIRIKASRQIESGLASLVAKGSLLAPEIDIQAGPDDSKADALAYVLLGRKLDEKSTEEGEELYAAAVTMGIRGGQYIARQIQSRLALDSVRVDDDRSTRKTSLLLSKYVTPNLLVTYGIGLFNSARNLNVLYNLDEFWAVEGNVGRESGADLLFSQEF